MARPVARVPRVQQICDRRSAHRSGKGRNDVGSPLPVEPAQQNRTWFRLYKALENDPAVLQVHRDFLLTRDYTGLATLFLVIYGTASVFVVPSPKILLIYLLFLVLQHLVARQAASRCGVRMVTTVIARATGKAA